MLVRILVIDVLAAALFLGIWYVTFLQCNRRRAARIVRWVEHAFAGHASIAGVHWLAASRFRVRMRVASSMFRQPSVVVQMLPRETPLRWLMSHLKKRSETMTFEADLDCAPTFNLDVHNHRWCGRTRRRPSGRQNWETESVGPIVLTTRSDWQREVTTMMNTLAASRDCDCLGVSVSRTSPHFSATVPLEAIAPGSQVQTEVFDIFRELAMGASAQRF